MCCRWSLCRKSKAEPSWVCKGRSWPTFWMVACWIFILGRAGFNVILVILDKLKNNQYCRSWTVWWRNQYLCDKLEWIAMWPCQHSAHSTVSFWKRARQKTKVQLWNPTGHFREPFGGCYLIWVFGSLHSGVFRNESTVSKCFTSWFDKCSIWEGKHKDIPPSRKILDIKVARM